MGGEEKTEETDLLKYSTGFSSTKMSVHDMELLMNSGFTRCGTYFYSQNMSKSCCENWHYVNNINQFKMSHSQKKVIRRFHRYLNFGNIHGEMDDLVAKSDKSDEDLADDSLQLVPNLQKPADLKEKILSAVKEVVERVVFMEFMEKMDMGKANEIMNSIHKRHKVNYNKNQGSLQSNILILDKEKHLLSNYKEHIEANLAKKLFEEYKKELEVAAAVDSFKTVFSSSNLCFVNIYLVDDAK